MKKIEINVPFTTYPVEKISIETSLKLKINLPAENLFLLQATEPQKTAQIPNKNFSDKKYSFRRALSGLQSLWNVRFILYAHLEKEIIQSLPEKIYLRRTKIRTS